MEVDPNVDVLGEKKDNFDFLLLVRNQNYPQALVLGRKILKKQPENTSVQKFVNFIEQNNKELVKMVEQQKEQAEYESLESGEEEESEGNSDKSDEGSDQSDDKDEEEEEEQQVQKDEAEKPNKKKIELSTCTLNQIPHICPRHHKEKNEGTVTGVDLKNKENGVVEIADKMGKKTEESTVGSEVAKEEKA